MEHSLEHFDIYPLVFPADKEVVINVKPLFKQVDFNLVAKVRVDYTPMLYPNKGQEVLAWATGNDAVFEVIDDGIVIRQFLLGEQEHGFAVYLTNADGTEEACLRFNVYSLNEDLMALRPYKGDFHMHSMESDGLECPEYVTASCRKVGFDFMVLTDHRKYEPSLRSVKFAESLPTGLKTFPGEEIHLPDNPVHIVNFGSSFSINDLANSDEAKYRKEVEEIVAGFPDEMPEYIRFQVASSEWAYDKIREGGGLAMFCHPYWRIAWRYNYIWESCVEWMFKRGKFDILELLGGYYRRESFSNNEQTAHYTQEMAKSNGKVDWAIAGVSDAHGCDRDLFGWYYTILFAEDCEFDSLKTAFKAQRSVAVKSIENECPDIYGSLRYVRYVVFLMKNFYPCHDKFCRLEGELMLRHLAGEEGICELLKTFPARGTAMFEKYWAGR